MHLGEFSEQVRDNPAAHIVCEIEDRIDWGDSGFEGTDAFNLSFYMQDNGTRHRIGYAEAALDHKAGEFYLVAFYPHANLEGAKRRGLGTAANLAMLQKLQSMDQRMPTYTFEATEITSPEMGKFLSSMGISFGDTLDACLRKASAFAVHKRYMRN